MKNGIEAMITDITATTAEAEDYTGEDGLLYCGKCHTPKEAYFAEGKTCFGRDRHPAECDCQRLYAALVYWLPRSECTMAPQISGYRKFAFLSVSQQSSARIWSAMARPFGSRS